MYNEHDERIMLSFLTKNYPVIRIKKDKKFKRAMITDNGKIYFLENKSSYSEIKKDLAESITIIFGCYDIKFIVNVLNKFLPLNQET